MPLPETFAPAAAAMVGFAARAAERMHGAMMHEMKIYRDDSDDTFGGRLSAARDAAGISVKAFANQLGVRSDTVQAWESDRSEPRSSRLVDLAGILGVSPMWLMTGMGQGPSESDANPSLESLRHQILRLADLHQQYGRMLTALTRQVERLESERNREA